MLENKVAETGEPLEKGLAGDPGTVEACGAVDMVPPPGCVELKMEGGAGQGTATASRADRVGAGGKGIAADWDVEPDLAGCNTAPGPESCILVLGGRKIPPVDHRALHPWLPVCDLACLLGIAVDLVGRNPGPGTLAQTEDR